jgi:hypothetical protein
LIVCGIWWILPFQPQKAISVSTIACQCTCQPSISAHTINHHANDILFSLRGTQKRGMICRDGAPCFIVAEDETAAARGAVTCDAGHGELVVQG